MREGFQYVLTVSFSFLLRVSHQAYQDLDHKQQSQPWCAVADSHAPLAHTASSYGSSTINIKSPEECFRGC